MNRRSENAWLRHLFHRRCQRCVDEGWQKGWQAAHKASRKSETGLDVRRLAQAVAVTKYSVFQPPEDYAERLAANYARLTSKQAVPDNPEAERLFRERMADSERGAA